MDFQKAQWKRQLGDLEAESASRTLASLKKKKKRREARGKGSEGWKEMERGGKCERELTFLHCESTPLGTFLAIVHYLYNKMQWLSMALFG